jgi:alkylhydroperoxidase/carboxymuconolactone decarboxylase family protein YurZ
MNEFNITKDEIVDVLRVVLLTSGMPAFNKGMRILDEIEKQ